MRGNREIEEEQFRRRMDLQLQYVQQQYNLPDYTPENEGVWERAVRQFIQDGGTEEFERRNPSLCNGK